MAHLLISAAHKSSGKTTVTLGLCAALRAQNLQIQPFKKGPDYIDPMWLGQAAGNPCHNLDFYTMQPDEIQATVGYYSAQADLALIEGNKGLYDGLDLDGSNSNAALAKLLKAPVILVIDARGMTRGIAPLILGYQAFDPDVNIAGVILNQLGGSRHESKLRAVIEHYTDVPVVGAVAREDSLEIVERHLGLIPSNEHEAAVARIQHIGETIGRQVDLARIRAIAASADKLPDTPPFNIPTASEKNIRLGIARDEAFGFYYPDDLAALERAGAELISINMLRDSILPDIDGLFIGGGFPETCMDELAANQRLRNAIRNAIESGLPTYAECGGLMYLARSLYWNGKRAEMVGVIPGDIEMHPRPQGRGYVRLEETDAMPWPDSADTDKQVAAHEFHYSGLTNLDPQARFAFKVLRGAGIDGQHDGFVYKNLLACYTHQRDTRHHRWAARFVAFVRQHQFKTAKPGQPQG
ncbi:MAG: hydrogenobyrinic acid a,c-diamide synthase (glutamine-hydrolyzing) [Gammaproteobacteria bacterium]|nr:hydrogenobyrinic acid a,c-diamide synthase (glutamine-hydrolyzing) [Gammaproteobacteria bacterium]MBU2477772.1 hydrogenobyrinic acid a,c-diamide synthase (glutamine-hydrolyzing) [Gammaproteobacteria bacterium]